jgi:hypothetical protein
MKEEITIIRLKKSTRERLKKFGQKGDSYDDIVTNLMDEVGARKR